MRWDDMINERDVSGNLTPLAFALAKLQEEGCSCDEYHEGYCDYRDREDRCLGCVCEAALRSLWDQLNDAASLVAYCLFKKLIGDQDAENTD